MTFIALVTEAEPWTTGNVVGALLLALLVTGIVIWAARRAGRN